MKNHGSLGVPLTVVLAGFFSFLSAADSPNLWKDLGPAKTASGAMRPGTARTLSLNRAAMAAVLARAPLESQLEREAAVLTLPMPDGAMTRFAVRESEVLSPELAACYPQIKTYSGVGMDDHSLTGRFDLTPAGFHALFYTGNGIVAIDPVEKSGGSLYTSSPLSDGSPRSGQCGVTSRTNPASLSMQANIGSGPAAVEDIPKALTQLKIYRIAVSTSAEYTARVGGTEASATASVTSVINRVNAVYERDLGIRFRLVATVVFTNAAAQPFDDTNQGPALALNQALLDQRVGTANYDLGHVFLSKAPGGLGVFEGLCNPPLKGQGISPLGTYTEALFATEMVAHEIGHQLNARHTFNSGGSPGCNEAQRDTSSNYEVGSGVTIMSYVGICGVTGNDPQDLDGESNGFFHTANVRQMLGWIGQVSCEAPPAGTRVNNAPQIQPFGNPTIPASTPFALAAVVTDPDAADQKNLTYSWEELDLATSASPPYTDDGTRPLMRNYNPAPNAKRFFPSLPYVLNNANVPPLSYQKSGFTLLVGEFLPTAARSLRFRLTVRDNRASDGVVAGSQAFADAVLAVRSDAGPFAVTAPNTSSVTWTAGSAQTVTWSVAKTDLDPISAKTVSILLSVDGGQTFPMVVASRVPNTGSASVTVPIGIPASDKARVMVQADGNVFFDVSDADFHAASAAAGANAPTIGAITHAASFLQVVSPGSLITIFGTNLTTVGAGGAGATATPLPTTLGGTSVTVNGVTIPLVVVFPGQINAQLPFETAIGDAVVVVTSGGVASAGAIATVVSATPAVFQYGTNRAVIINADGSTNSAGAPAKVGTTVLAYFTGPGPLDQPVTTGAVAPGNPPARVKDTAMSVTLGGTPVIVDFAGLSPGSVGLGQINLRIPTMVPGDYPLVITIGGYSGSSAIMTVAN